MARWSGSSWLLAVAIFGFQRAAHSEPATEDVPLEPALDSPADSDGSAAQAPEPTSPEPPFEGPAPGPSETPPPPSEEPLPSVLPELPPREPPRLHARPDKDAPVGAEPRREPRRGHLALELDLGVNARLAESAAFRSEQTIGARYGIGFWLNAFDNAWLGIALEQTELGSASDQSGQNLVDVEFSATTAWIGGRFVPYRSGRLETFLALRLGLVTQQVQATGVRQRGSALDPPTGFRCSELAGPDVALGGGIGASLGLGPRVRLSSRLDANAQRLTGEVIRDCAVGIGSATSVAVVLGLAYEFGGPRPN